MHLGTRLFNLLLVTVPAGAIAVWGYIYLEESYDALQAPGLPIEYFQKTDLGRIRIWADSYEIDVQNRRATVLGVKVQKPDKSILFYAKRLTVGYRRFAEGEARTFNLEASKVQLTLARNKNGEIEVQKLFPPSDQKSDPIGYRFKGRDIKIFINDEFAKVPGPSQLSLPKVDVFGNGDHNRVKTAGMLGTVGFALKARISGDGSASGNVSFVDSKFDRTLPYVMELIGQAKTLKEFGVKIADSRARGRLRFAVQSEFKFAVEGPLDVRTVNLSAIGSEFGESRLIGYLSQSGLRGSLFSNQRGSVATFNGGLDWDPFFRYEGAVKGRFSSLSTLPKFASQIAPKGLQANDISVNGWVSSGQKAIRASGNTAFSEVRYQGEVLRKIDAYVNLQNAYVTWLGKGGTRYGDLTSGGRYETDKGTAQLGLKLPQIRINPSPRFVRGVQGQVTGYLSGKLDNLAGDFYTDGLAEVRAPDQPWTSSVFDARARLIRNKITIEQSYLRSNVLTLLANGDILNFNDLNLDIYARALRLDYLDPSAVGTANAAGKLIGSLQNPKFVGLTELYGVKYAGTEIAGASAQLVADANEIRVSKFGATSASSIGTGELVINPKNGKLAGNGSLKNIQLGDYLGEAFFGGLDVSNVRISGTIAKPIIAGQVSASGIVAFNSLVEQLSGEFRYQDGILTAPRFALLFTKGTAAGRLAYKTKTSELFINAQLDELDLDDLITPYSNQVAIQGTGSGGISLVVKNKVLSSGRTSLKVRDLLVNEVAFGSGGIEATVRDDAWDFEGEVGQLARYVSISKGRYRPKTEEIAAELSIAGLPLGDVVRTGYRYVPDLNVRAQQLALGADGVINVGGTVSGNLKDPKFLMELGSVTDFRIDGRSLGSIIWSGDASRQGLGLTALNYFEPANAPETNQPNIRARGRIEFDRESNLDVEISKLPLPLFSVAYAPLARFGGMIDRADLVLSGKTTNPQARGSALISLPTASATSPTFDLNLDEITLRPGLDQKALLAASGTANYLGVSALVSVGVPIDFTRGIDEDRELMARIEVPSRDMNDLAPFFPNLQWESGTGAIGGEVRLNGTIQKPILNGIVNFSADKFRLKQFGTGLDNVVALAQIRENAFTLDFTTSSSLGGELSLSLSSDFNALLQNAFSTNDPDRFNLNRIAIGGTLGATKFDVEQLFTQKGQTVGKFSARLDASLSLEGQLNAPQISGSVTAKRMTTSIPPIEAQSQERVTYAIDPVFNVDFALDDNTVVETLSAQLALGGRGKLFGKLSEPKIQADFGVAGGNLRLTNTNVRVDRGGVVRFRYSGSEQEQISSLNVDLTARTNLTTRNETGTPQRYQVNLEVKGNLLESEGLSLVATSTPADLSQAKIFSLLGRQDIVESLAAGQSGEALQNQIRNAFTGVAIPNLLDPITSSLARTFGLEYLNFEYNTLGETEVIFEKYLNQEIFFAGRRQISPPSTGVRAQYDFTVNYRPIRFKGLLSKFNFSVGADQDRPLKLSLQYTIRF